MNYFKYPIIRQLEKNLSAKGYAHKTYRHNQRKGYRMHVYIPAINLNLIFDSESNHLEARRITQNFAKLSDGFIVNFDHNHDLIYTGYMLLRMELISNQVATSVFGVPLKNTDGLSSSLSVWVMEPARKLHKQVFPQVA